MIRLNDKTIYEGALEGLSAVNAAVVTGIDARRATVEEVSETVRVSEALRQCYDRLLEIALSGGQVKVS